MSVSIVDHELPYETHNLYDVTCFDDQIRTLVTHTPSFVDTWVSEIESLNSSRLIVGLDIEWRPNHARNIEHAAATLQLCVGSRCLIFQLIYAPSIPASLVNFLGNPAYTFVGVGIDSDVEKLTEDYGLSVATTIDLRSLAAQKFGVRELRNAGLKNLAIHVLGKEIKKPKRVTMSRWDTEWLTPAQVQYACIDAFISSEIGKHLKAAGADDE